MNIKKIMAGVVGSALAVSTMAVAASAGTIKYSGGDFYDDGSGNYQYWILGDGADEANDIDYSAIATIEITLSWDAAEVGDEGWIGGAIVSQCDSASWNQLTSWANGEGADIVLENGGTYTGEVSFPADSTYVILAFQNWGEANLNIDSIVLKDASGTVLPLRSSENAPAETEAPVETEAPTDDAPASTEAPAAGTGNTSTPTNDKQNADTGIEGVAIVAGLAIIAAGAVVVAKKRG